MKKLPQFTLSDEATMRAFYESCGVSKSTTEAAIKLRLSEPVEEPQMPPPLKGKPKRKQQAT
jgi:hypothetical protein